LTKERIGGHGVHSRRRAYNYSKGEEKGLVGQKGVSKKHYNLATFRHRNRSDTRSRGPCD